MMPATRPHRTEDEWIQWGEQVRADVLRAATGLTRQQVERKSDEAERMIRGGDDEASVGTQLVADEWYRITFMMQPDRLGRGGMDRYDPAKDWYRPPKGVNVR